MSFFSSWVLSIIGISLIGIVADLIIPNGKMLNVVKTTVAIFTVLIIVKPISNLNITSVSSVFNSEIVVDSGFVEKYEKVKIENLKTDIEKNLSIIGYLNINIDFNLNENGTICNVYVDLKRLVLKENELNINKYTNIVAVIKNFVNLDGEDIIFYE